MAPFQRDTETSTAPGYLAGGLTHVSAILLLVAITQALPIHDTMPIKLSKLEDGLAITELGTLHQMIATWDIYVTLDAPVFPSALRDQIPRLNNTLEALKALSRQGLPFTLQTHTFRVAQLESQLALFGKSTRQRRGLIDVGGSILSALFGVATTSQLERFQATLDDVSENQDAIAHSLTHLASIINQTRAYSNQLAIQQYHMSTQLIHIKVAIGKLSDIMQDHEGRIKRLELIADFERYLTVLELSMASYLTQQQKFNRQRNELATGQLTRDLLPSKDLQNILTAASATHGTIKNLDWYYAYINVAPMTTKANTLIYHIQLPLIAPRPYLLYQVIAHPLPIANTSMAAVVNLAPQYAMATTDGFIFAPSNCLGSRPTICQNSPEYNSEHMACPRGILTKRPELIAKCKVNIIPAPSTPIITSIGINQYAFTSFGSHIIIRCSARPEQHIIVPKGAFNMSCLKPCTIHGAEWRLTCVDRMYIEHHIRTPPVLVPGRLNLSALFAEPRVLNVLQGLHSDDTVIPHPVALELDQLRGPILKHQSTQPTLHHHIILYIIFGIFISTVAIFATILCWQFRHHLRIYATHRATTIMTSIPMIEPGSTEAEDLNETLERPGPTTRLWPILPPLEKTPTAPEQQNVE